MTGAYWAYLEDYTARAEILINFRGSLSKSLLSDLNWKSPLSPWKENCKLSQLPLEKPHEVRIWSIQCMYKAELHKTTQDAELWVSQAVGSGDWSAFFSFWATGRNSNSQHAQLKSLPSSFPIHLRASSSSKELHKKSWQNMNVAHKSGITCCLLPLKVDNVSQS